jgi:RND family efflux transporter MFP subunit
MHPRTTIVSGISLLALGGLFYVFTHRASDVPQQETASATESTLPVSVVPALSGSLPVHRELFGTVTSLSGSTHAYSLPYEATLAQLRVAPGQHVEIGDPLFDCVRSPSAAVVAQSADEQRVEAAQRLKQLVSREADGLATRDEMIQAKASLRRAELTVLSMKRSGQFASKQTIKATRAGVISGLLGQTGALMPPGTPVLSVVEDESIGAELWGEPSSVRTLAAGQDVTLKTLDSHTVQRARGRVERISHQVDALRRLVRVTVTLGESPQLILGAPVQGLIQTDAPEGLLLPRSALVMRDGELYVFTVSEHRARAHRVIRLAEDENRVLIAPSFEENSPVITLGAYQTEDGMKVEFKP